MSKINKFIILIFLLNNFNHILNSAAIENKRAKEAQSKISELNYLYSDTNLERIINSLNSQAEYINLKNELEYDAYDENILSYGLMFIVMKIANLTDGKENCLYRYPFLYKSAYLLIVHGGKLSKAYDYLQIIYKPNKHFYKTIKVILAIQDKIQEAEDSLQLERELKQKGEFALTTFGQSAVLF